MPTIKSVGDLPDWFRLSDYDICDNFTAKEWGEQLIARTDEYLCAKDSQFVLANYDRSRIATLIAKTTQGCVRNIGHDNSLATEQTSFFFSPEGGIMKYWPVQPASIESISDGLDFHDYLDPLEQQDSIAYDEIKLRAGYAAWYATIEIDLDAPDSVLIEYFKELLTKYRELLDKEGTGKKVSEASIQRLRQYKVLAYLDLTHWAALSGTHIHGEVLARALFPNSERSDRFISETLKPWAKSAMQPIFFRTLLASKH